MRRALAVALALPMLVAACRPVDLRSLDGTEWRAVRINDIVPAAGHELTIRFANGMLTMTTECTTFSERVSIDLAAKPPHLGREGLVATMAQACLGRPLPQAEVTIGSVYGSVEFIELEGGHLVLKGAAGAIEFAPVGSLLVLQ
jgi:hypothetical protein